MTTNVLVLCEDKWHPAQVVRGGLELLSQEDFHFDVSEVGSEWSAERMAQYPLVMLARVPTWNPDGVTPWLTLAAEEAFAEYVQTGGGLMVVHAGSCVLASPALRRLIGGTFVRHPPRCDVTVTPQGDYPITADVEPFTVFDEHYFMETDNVEAQHFLLTTSENGVQSGGWLLEEGEGRICVLTPGHEAAVWTHPEYQTLLRNGLLWCIRQLPMAPA
jgi:type 1 glutamine amidotransferase